MLMHQPKCYRGEDNVKLEGWQVIDLETAVKGGILCGSGEVICKEEKKLDLKKMILELRSLEVPSVFICPISLEPMLEPVTLCTGQTYERSNILKWLSLGHYTCPTTMQKLWDVAVTPNRTLQQLIYSWFSQKYLAMKKRSEDVEGRVIELLESLKKVKGRARVMALKELRQVFSKHGGAAKKAMKGNGGVGLVISLLGCFTSHAVGSEAIGILVNLDLDLASKTTLMQPPKLSLIIDSLNEGSIETKISCTRLIEKMMESKDLGFENSPSLSLLVGLLRLARDRRHPNGVLAGLGLLRTLCSHESITTSVVSIGAVPQLVEVLPSLNKECLELALQILEKLSAIPEGRSALKDCANAIPSLVQLLMKVSEICTQLLLSILWALCKLAPEECSAMAIEAGLAAKLLLVIQSGYGPMLKQQSTELLKLCSLNYSATIFISKWKLTTTIQ